MRSSDVVVIGAGPYGLSIAAHLTKMGVSYECFGEPMASWRHSMPLGMLLRSEARASNLWDPDRQFTLRAYCDQRGMRYISSGPPVSLSLFMAYCEWFQSQTAPNVRNIRVKKLSKAERGFQLELDDGDGPLFARRVVVATGHMAFRYLPRRLRKLSPEFVSHSSDHFDLSSFKNKEVIVVGGGQSALETAALLHEQGTRVRLLLRKDRVQWNAENLGERSLLTRIVQPESGLGFGWRRLVQSEVPQIFAFFPKERRVAMALRALRASGAWWLKPRLVEHVPILASHHIDNCVEAGNGIRLTVRADGEYKELAADHIIAATGYKPDVARIPILDRRLISEIKSFGGFPKLTGNFESTVPGLHFAGMLSAGTFGPVMRFMFGAKHTAPALARTFTRQQSARPLSARFERGLDIRYTTPTR
jgi:FAD-dependent urate hydroxylase